MKEKPRNGDLEASFTLIELLVVVAVIAILAAIAVVNMLEAQTRAKVSRAKTDIRTLVTGITAYAVDANHYPIVADEKGEAIAPYPPVGLGPEAFETRMSPVITTPVAYISSLPVDPFASGKPDPDDPRIVEGRGFHYGNAEYALANNGEPGAMKYKEFIQMLYGNPDAILYHVSSHGPDLDHDDDEVPTDPNAAVHYDPTNGTVSNGDIIYFGPGRGFNE